MRRSIVALLAIVPAAAFAAQISEGRWEGRLEIPGRELPLVVDLARDGTGVWSGSIIVPGLGITGAPLSNLVVAPKTFAFDLGSVLANPTFGPARWKGSLTSEGRMKGEVSQAGNVARFALTKVGLPQVESSPRSTAVTRDLEGEWRGEFELGGYPRQVTITLENRADAATAKLVIVGKRTNDLAVDLVIEEGAFLRLESKANAVTFEGRLSKERNQIDGAIDFGPFVLPLVLHRLPGGSS